MLNIVSDPLGPTGPSNFSKDNSNLLSVLSFNMYGFNQGCQAIHDVIADVAPEVILVQEHWL